MYFNVFGERVSRARYKEMLNAAKNRRELVAAQFDRRELIKMGLVTAAGLLAPIKGLSARAFPQQGVPNLCAPGNQTASPPTTPFTVALPILAVAQSVPVASLGPAPTINPNTAAGEGRTRPHQAFTQFPPRKFYNSVQRQITQSFSPNLPLQTIWGWDDSNGHVHSPGFVYAFKYGEPVLVRNHNALPPEGQNGGFGKPSVSTHLHNHHTPSESDGFPGDFFERGQFYDHHYTNQLAGVLSTHRSTGGDINEALSSLWFHDHRLNFTSQNTYKGLLGLCCIFNEFDTGNEHTGFRLPSFPEFDIPMAFQDKVFDPETGLLAFDLFNLDGILGDKFLINGQIQPFFKVKPRRYRFRMVDTGPSRFYEFFLTDPNNLNAVNPYWVIANDGNLLPKPVKVTSVRIGVAERVDVIVDFRPFAGKSIFLENRLSQLNGQGPVIGQECGVPEIMAAGQGNMLMRFDVDSQPVDDDSEEPEEMTFYALPTMVEPRITRTFKFDRLNGQWSVNGQFVDVNTPRLRVGMNTEENWVLSNITGNWTHPVHIHFEEHQIISRNRVPPSLAIERARKDVTQLRPNSRVQLFFRFRDFHGRYIMHCHNLIHEDHAMMLRWDIDPDGGDDVMVP